MAMSQSERIRYIQEEANRYLARWKGRDSSELTLMRQAKASSVEVPTTVQGKVSAGSCERTFVSKGAGTGGEYTNVLQRAQGCAICADPDPTVNASRGITLPVVCIDRTKQPFAQQDLNGTVYLSPCTPGYQVFRTPFLPDCRTCNTHQFPSG